jgi:hypothetical protein
MAGTSKGFEIALHNQRNILRVRAWGSWDTELAKKFEDTFQEKIHEIGAAGKSWYLLADFRAFSPQLEEVQRMISQQITPAENREIKKIGYLGERAGIQLRLKRLFQKDELPKQGFFESEGEAIEWLLSDLSHEVHQHERGGSPH